MTGAGPAKPDSHRHAADWLKSQDPERFAASLVLPSRQRRAVQAIWAFSADVAAIRDRVSEPTPGEIRLQWWVDALEGRGHGQIAQNPIADALFDTLHRHDLPAGPLLRLLAARRFDLYQDPMPDIGQFEGYAGETTSVLFQYAAMILADGPADSAADAAGHLGVAQALAGHVRAFGFNASRGRIFLPMSIFAAHGVRETDILAGRPGAELDSALMQIGELAQDHLARARTAIALLPRSLRPAFASAALIGPELERNARRGGEAVFTAPTPGSGLGRLARLVWWTLRNS